MPRPVRVDKVRTNPAAQSLNPANARCAGSPLLPSKQLSHAAQPGIIFLCYGSSAASSTWTCGASCCCLVRAVLVCLPHPASHTDQQTYADPLNELAVARSPPQQAAPPLLHAAAQPCPQLAAEPGIQPCAQTTEQRPDCANGASIGAGGDRSGHARSACGSRE